MEEINSNMDVGLNSIAYLQAKLRRFVGQEGQTTKPLSGNSDQ